MEQEIRFSTKISRRNRTAHTLPIPKLTSDAHPQIKNGLPVNVILIIVEKKE